MNVRVLHIINQLDIRAGAELSLQQFILSTHGPEHTHAIVALRGKAPAPDALVDAGVTIFRGANGAPGKREAVRVVLDGIDQFRPDLVHTSLFEADLAGRIAAMLRGVPAITSLVNTPYAPEALAVEPSPRWKLRGVQAVDRALARGATTAFHAISEATAVHAVRHLGVRRKYIRVVPRGRRMEALGDRTEGRRQRVRAALGIGEGPMLLTIARQEPQKGHALLLDAMAIVRQRFPGAILVLVGRTGRSTKEIRDRLRRLELGPAVVDLGERTDVPDLLAAADLMVSAALYEGLGGAVVEAAGAGLPVIGFDIAPLREVLGPSHPWLTSPHQAETLADALLGALADGPAAWRAVALAQRARFLERFEMAAISDRMLELYRDVQLGLTNTGVGRRFHVPRVPIGS